jgi:tetratricopeptide (TPR) repeat protein
LQKRFTMKPIHLIILSVIALISCGTEEVQSEVTENKTPIVQPKVVQPAVAINKVTDPKDMLGEAYQQFKEGNDEASILIANDVLAIGRATNNDTLIGGALSSLCRNAQRTLDTVRLGELSTELITLAETSGDQKWMMKMAHMNAEMWRLVGDMAKAEAYYNQSMRISESIGATGMFTIDHFNKSFVSTATGDYVEANRLISKYYALRQEADSTSEDAYGLIALAYLLEQKGNYEGAHEVATVTRRLFEEQNIFPEPPDEKPLLAAEAKVREELSPEELEKVVLGSEYQTVNDLIAKFLTTN